MTMIERTETDDDASERTESDNDIPDLRARSSDDEVVERDGMDGKHDDDAVNVPRIGGGTIDVPVYSKPRRRLTPAERVAYDNRKTMKMRAGAWAQT